METTVLLSTITKIGGLMRIGFGEAGAGVIGRNLAESNVSKLNLMSSGLLINSIFGFCDVRNFTDTTECLQEEVMLFVNRIAHILHGIVVQCSGSANKNIGDAFLLTWKLDKSHTDEEKTILADKALFAFLKTLVNLSRYEDFICDFSDMATDRLYKRFPAYVVRIGCGLHTGWAIEGAIGTHRKIDVSYLSPHVNFSEYLEGSTKQYKVNLLMSEVFHGLLSAEAKKWCRAVDRVRRTRDEEPTYLYTYDSDLRINFAIKSARRASSRWSAFEQVIHRSMSARTGSSYTLLSGEEDDAMAPPSIEIDEYDSSVWDTDIDIVRLRHRIDDDFREKWSLAVTQYTSGDWISAEASLTSLLARQGGDDGPAKFLLQYIRSRGGGVPTDWEGYRPEYDD
jgi:class 3 adenylate cyclase